MEASLIYTYNIRGDLALLPRLYTFIRGLRLPGSLLVDLGKSCDAEAWHCAITQGRSVLFALDAMNYHAANVQGVLTAASRQKLAESAMLALVDDSHPHQHADLSFTTRLHSASPTADGNPHLTINLTPAHSTHIEASVLHLAPVECGQVGFVRWHGDTLLEHGIHTMPAKTPPDATIAGAVDFVIAEARYYQDRHQGE